MVQTHEKCKYQKVSFRAVLFSNEFGPPKFSSELNKYFIFKPIKNFTRRGLYLVRWPDIMLITCKMQMG